MRTAVPHDLAVERKDAANPNENGRENLQRKESESALKRVFNITSKEAGLYSETL